MAGGNQGDYARQLATEQQQRVGSAMQQVEQAFSGYTPEFYQKRADAYMRSANPQLAQQYLQSRNALQYGLAGRGLYRSSAGERLGDQLQQQLAGGQQAIAEGARTSAQNLQQQVENYRNQVVGQVQQSVDPSATAQSMLGAAAQFSAPSIAPSIANQFGTWAQYYLQSNLAQNQSQPTTTYNNPMVNPGP